MWMLNVFRPGFEVVKEGRILEPFQISAEVKITITLFTIQNVFISSTPCTLGKYKGFIIKNPGRTFGCIVWNTLFAYRCMETLLGHNHFLHLLCKFCHGQLIPL